MPSDFAISLGRNAPTAPEKRISSRWLLVVLALPLLAACLVFDLVFQLIVRLR